MHLLIEKGADVNKCDEVCTCTVYSNNYALCNSKCNVVSTLWKLLG